MEAGLEVGHQPVKELLGFHLPGHEGVAGTEFGEGLEHAAQLADQQDAAFAFREQGDELRAGFLLETDEPDRHPGTAGGLGDQHRVDALAGDQGQRTPRVKVGGKEGGEGGHAGTLGTGARGMKPEMSTKKPRRSDAAETMAAQDWAP
jgi:hypothetical protein